MKYFSRFRCSHCNYATVEKAALDKHVRFKHTNERPFMCDTCGFSTHTASSMARHKRSHSNTKPHKCEICGHEYADKKRLRDHMYTHTDHKPFQCQFCSYTCRRKDNLKAHLKKNHDLNAQECKNHDNTTLEKKEKLEKVEVIPVVESSPSGHSPTSGVLTNTWPHVSSAPTSDLEPPKPVWQQGHASRGTSSSSSYLPTIALGDLVLTTGSGQGEAVTTDPGGGEVTWTVDTGVTDHGEVIFVQASEPSDKN